MEQLGETLYGEGTLKPSDAFSGGLKLSTWTKSDNMVTSQSAVECQQSSNSQLLLPSQCKIDSASIHHKTLTVNTKTNELYEKELLNSLLLSTTTDFVVEDNIETISTKVKYTVGIWLKKYDDAEAEALSATLIPFIIESSYFITKIRIVVSSSVVK